MKQECIRCKEPQDTTGWYCHECRRKMPKALGGYINDEEWNTQKRRHAKHLMNTTEPTQCHLHVLTLPKHKQPFLQGYVRSSYLLREYKRKQQRDQQWKTIMKYVNQIPFMP